MNGFTITRSKLLAWSLPLAAAALIAAPSDASAQFYRLESGVTLKSAAPNWDYLTFEPARSYLYINRREDGVTVYDATTKKVVRDIEQSQGANATILVPEFDRAYTVNQDGTTTIFQMSSLKTIQRQKFAEAGDSGTYEPVTRQLLLTNGDSKEIVFLNAETAATVGALKTESTKLEFPTPDGQGNVFVALRDRNSVLKIDARGRSITAEWKTEACVEPNGLAFDRVNKRLFLGCRGQGKTPVLAVMDATSGRVITTLDIGRGNDGVVYDPETRRIYASNGVDGNLVVIQQVDADTYRLAQAATTRPFARTMALDPKTKTVFLVTAEGTVDPSKKVNKGPSALYPNRYFPDTFVVLTYAQR